MFKYAVSYFVVALNLAPRASCYPSTVGREIANCASVVEKTMNKTFRKAAEITCLNATKDRCELASDGTIYEATRSGVTGNVGYSGTLWGSKVDCFFFLKK